ncbi:glycosyltransferase family 1 protein [Sphingomonas daechungensis]|uniref:glycosyltransferase family 4 protein n=1 Tax=Sphingomonas daechungensis TaxID=1176646 RepID=UPI0031EE705E
MADAPLHICVDATSWVNDRGFGRFTREILKALLSRDTGFQYTLLFDQLPEEDLPESAKVLTARTDLGLNQSAVGSSARSPGYFLKMARLAKSVPYDVFFFPTLYSYFPLLQRKPTVVCYHDATAERFPQLLFPTKTNHWLWQAKTALARLQTTRAMTVSETSARDLETIHRFPKERIDVVTEAADDAFRIIDDPALRGSERTLHGIPADARVLVHVGGMNAHKNILGLLKALPKIIAAEPRTHLALVGDTSGKGFWDNVGELKAFIAATPPLSAHVHFTGYISDPDLAKLLNAADALVFPSLWEGFGLPAVEAMSCGIPVLASSRGGSLPEVVGDGGLLFEPEDPDAIAACVIGFLHDDKLRAQLTRNAIERAKLFSWSRGAELAEDSFRRCYSDAQR